MGTIIYQYTAPRILFGVSRISVSVPSTIFVDGIYARAGFDTSRGRMDIIVENLPARELWFLPTGPSSRSTRLHSADPVACISFVAAVRHVCFYLPAIGFEQRHIYNLE